MRAEPFNGIFLKESQLTLQGEQNKPRALTLLLHKAFTDPRAISTLIRFFFFFLQEQTTQCCLTGNSSSIVFYEDHLNNTWLSTEFQRMTNPVPGRYFVFNT